MKRIVFALISLFLLIVSSAFASSPVTPTPVFDHMRTVIIAPTTQGSGPARYMAARLRQPFRLPYYQKQEISEMLGPEDINQDALRSLATAYHADIVLVPVVKQWYYEEYHSYWRDEMITEYHYVLAIYAYDRKADTFKAYDTYGWDKDETSVLNQPQAIMSDAMDVLMKKLPYKRIPTDLDDANYDSSVLPTTTTAGKAKILTTTSPIAI